MKNKLKLAVRGADLLALLADLGDRIANGPVGSFPQVAGMKLSYQRDLPAGKRLVGAWLADGSEIEAEKTYSLAVSDFLAAGNDGYGRLKNARRLVDQDEGPVETEAVMAFVRRTTLLRYSGEGRVSVK